MKKPIINPASEKIVLSTVKYMPQSLLLTGEYRVGLSTISRYIAELRKVDPTVILPEKDDKIDLEKGVIGVDIMRKLYDETKTKLSVERIIIIDYAERMTHQAQNAFLKLLEEPGEGVYFILVTHSNEKLLTTILSRAEVIDIKPITNNQSKKLLNTLNVMDEKKRSQILFIAEGLPAEITYLSADDNYFEKRSDTVKDARNLLTGRLYEKLLIAHRYKDDRPASLMLLLDAAKILKLTISNNPQKDTIEMIDIILKTYQRIEANGNIRLSLAKMIF